MFTVRKHLVYGTYGFREVNSILVSKTLEFLEQDHILSVGNGHVE